MTDTLADFAADLAREDRADKTVESYLRDLRHFAHFFTQNNAEPFSPAAITRMDIKDCRRYLTVQLHAKPATVNRRLAAVRRFCRWARGRGLIGDDPAEGIKGVQRERLQAPKSLSRNQVQALIRAVHRHGGKRDVAIVQLLRHTGIWVGQLVGLRLDDVATSGRKESIGMRWGRSDCSRAIRLSLEGGWALGECFVVRPKVAEGHPRSSWNYCVYQTIMIT